MIRESVASPTVQRAAQGIRSRQQNGYGSSLLDLLRSEEKEEAREPAEVNLDWMAVVRWASHRAFVVWLYPRDTHRR